MAKTFSRKPQAKVSTRSAALRRQNADLHRRTAKAMAEAQEAVESAAKMVDPRREHERQELLRKAIDALDIAKAQNVPAERFQASRRRRKGIA
jgi:hypothetical protein